MASPVLDQPLLLGMMRLLEYPELGEPQALLGFKIGRASCRERV